FTFIPVGSIAFRINLMTCVFGALTIFAIFHILRKLSLSPLSSLFGSVTVAVSYSFWLYAITSEVFMLNNLIAAIIILLTLSWRERRKKEQNNYFSSDPAKPESREITNKSSRRAALARTIKNKSNGLIYLLAFVYGLGFANHTSIVLLGPFVLYLILITDKTVLLRRFFHLWFFFFLGLLPYIQTIIASMLPHYPGFGNLAGFNRFIQYITRADYGGLFSPGAIVTPASNYWDLPVYYLKLLFTRFTPLAPLFALSFTIKSFWKRDHVGIALSVALFLTGFFFPLYAFKGVEANDLHILGVVERFGQLGFMLLGIVAVAGLYKFIKANYSEKNKIIFCLILLFFISYFLFTNYPKVDKSTYLLAKNYSLNILKQVEDNSIIIITDDLTGFALFYFVHAENIKPNIRIVNLAMSGTWYQKELKKTWPDLFRTKSTYEYNVARDIIHTNQGKRPIYIVTLDDPYPLGFDGNPYFLTPMGLVMKVDEKATAQEVQESAETNYWKKYNYDGLKNEYADSFAKLLKTYYPFRHRINAKVYLRSGCLACAKKELEEAIKLDPNDLAAKRELGMSKTVFPNHPERKTAKEYLDSAYALIRAEGFQQNLNLHRAIWDLVQAEKLDPKNEEVHGALGELYEFFGAYKDSIEEYEKAYAVNPSELDWKSRANTVRRKAPKTGPEPL
ncbi:MAG: DUF2723 domain-containing protein, partial [Candidatus Levybacteria bacterium]|nr:DUF2723 domain-containing protein [Candidatus Levybacteria bacterium]